VLHGFHIAIQFAAMADGLQPDPAGVRITGRMAWCVPLGVVDIVELVHGRKQAGADRRDTAQGCLGEVGVTATSELIVGEGGGGFVGSEHSLDGCIAGGWRGIR